MKTNPYFFAFAVLSIGWGLLTAGVYLNFDLGNALICASMPFIGVSCILIRGLVPQDGANE